jgi:uncharacterized Zn finger protein
MAWFQYESTFEKKQRMERELRKRAAQGEVLTPLELSANKRKIAGTFWGRSWCQHIESYRDYENRLPRARSYLRQGSVFNLEVEQGKIRAQVAGSTLYDVEITIKPIEKKAWAGIQQACAGQVGSLLDLLGGQLGSGVMAVISDKERGLFPSPREIRFNCSCPDYASLCKHSGAVLYGVAVKFDADPALFFRLRGVDPSELLASGADQTLSPAAEAALDGEDLSALFGIDFGQEVEVVPPEMPPAVPAFQIPSLKKSTLKKPARRKTAVKKPAAKTPVVKTPVVKTPVVKTPVVKTPVVKTPVVKTPVVKTPVVKTPVVKTPVVKTPVAKAPVAKAPVAKAPVAKAPVAKAPVAKAPVAKAPVAKKPARDHAKRAK